MQALILVIAVRLLVNITASVLRAPIFDIEIYIGKPENNNQNTHAQKNPAPRAAETLYPEPPLGGGPPGGVARGFPLPGHKCYQLC